MNRHKESDAGDGERTQMNQVDQHVHVVQTQPQTKEEQRQKNGEESAHGAAAVCGAVVVESAVVEEQREDVVGDPQETRTFQKNEEQPRFPHCFGALWHVVEGVGFGGGGGGVET